MFSIKILIIINIYQMPQSACYFKNNSLRNYKLTLLGLTKNIYTREFSITCMHATKRLLFHILEINNCVHISHSINSLSANLSTSHAGEVEVAMEEASVREEGDRGVRTLDYSHVRQQ